MKVVFLGQFLGDIEADSLHRRLVGVCYGLDMRGPLREPILHEQIIRHFSFDASQINRENLGGVAERQQPAGIGFPFQIAEQDRAFKEGIVFGYQITDQLMEIAELPVDADRFLLAELQQIGPELGELRRIGQEFELACELLPGDFQGFMDARSQTGLPQAAARGLDAGFDVGIGGREQEGSQAVVGSTSLKGGAAVQCGGRRRTAAS